MEKSIDKDIHMLKSYAGMTHKLTDNQGRPKLDQAIENVLKELEIKDKMIDKICSDIALDFGYDKEDVKIRYRKLVEKDDR